MAMAMDAHAPMVDLARARRTDGDTIAPAMAAAPRGPDYPYGCCVSLDDETLKKLGLDGDLPAAGEMVHFCAEAMVTCGRVSADGQSHCVELQIIRMGVPMAPENRAERWYGEGHAEPDEDDM